MLTDQTPSMFVPALVFMVLGTALCVVILLLSYVVRAHRPQSLEKLSTYECGEHSLGQAWAQFNVRYYIFVLAFVVFDVETVFIYPWAVSLKWFKQHQMSGFAFWDMMVFVFVLGIGLYYAYRKGALEWV